MRHRIAPPEPMPEFMVEVGYLTDLSMLWKLRRAPVYESGLGELSIEFLARWQVHRQPLVKFCQARFDPRRVVPTVRACLDFMDALVSDWQKELSGKTPELPLDVERLRMLGEHRNRLQNIPGEKWEIKY